jgi:hypothetical protein
MHHVVRPALNDRRYEALLGDKWVFSRMVASLGLPAPRTLGVYAPGTGCREDGRALRDAAGLAELLEDHAPIRLVVKPVAGRGGKGVFFVQVDREGGLEVDGGPTTVDRLAARIGAMHSDGIRGALLQERVAPHDDIAAINRTALNALRVHTLLRGDGDVEVGEVVLRVARTGRETESLAEGALAIDVAADGRLGPGIARAPLGSGRPVTVHPDTGVTFSGRALPDWERVQSIVIAGASALPKLRSVGWDVALTAEGPLVIEANADWNPLVAQTHGRGWLTDTVLAELEACGVAPPFASPRLRTAARRLKRRAGASAVARAARLFGIRR